ncbi:RelA/SpoT domain-containing protein [Hyphomonas sp. FCG-A18]|uniref:hypothetical protein n=1 Tax=Hyphomonas sp. FCG-A18 TaxID=3080019 RepID=UPI002B2AC16F|nr:RelA/SpoT domain-containing protein [Hyphomonas sp. FCG-A18]
MNFEDYKNHGGGAYLELARTVKMLLEQALNAEGGYRLQQIQFRAKSPESLLKRLEEIDQTHTETIERHRKDLAGCRIVFYTNGDVERLTRSGLLRELFEVDWERMRVHHPKPGEVQAEKLFQSTNYVVRLKEDRTNLLEYSHLAGLACEVQVQTTLTHAWAEMAHDTVYKRPFGKGFGTREMGAIERRLQEAMRDYLVPAGHIFQKIRTDMDRLLEGKALFDNGAVQAAADANDNNDRYDALKRLKDDVLPYFDNIETEFSTLLDDLRDVWLKADATATKPHVTTYGDYPGHDSHDVTGLICGIFRRYRYVRLAGLFATVQDLYTRTQNEGSKSQLVELAENMASHTMQVWQRAGPWAQSELSQQLSSECGTEDHTPINIAVAAEILKSDISGTTSSSDSVTWHSGSVIFSDTLASARRDAISFLFKALTNRTGPAQLASILSALFNATQPPSHGKDDTALMQMILDESAMIVRQVIPLIDGLPFEQRRALESKVHNVWRRYHVLPEYLASETGVCASHAKLQTEIRAFRETISVDVDYRFHKTLFGYGSILEGMWDDPNQHHETVSALRTKDQDEFLEQISLETWSVWKPRILHSASTDFYDGADFPPFERFVGELADRQPDLALDLLRERAGMPDWTIRPLVQAIWTADYREECKNILRQWISDGDHLIHVAVSQMFIKDIDLTLVHELTERAVETADVDLCTTMLELSCRRFPEDEGFFRDRVFMPCLDIVSKANSSDWVNRTWFSASGDSLFSSLNEDDRKSLLDALTHVPTFDHRLEYILVPIAKEAPGEIMRWIGERLRYGIQSSDSDYTDIPFQFYELAELLRPFPRLVLDQLLEFSSDETLEPSQWSLKHFLSRVYNGHLSELSPTLLEFIQDADVVSLSFVSEHIEGFEGAPELLPVLRAVLTSPAATDEIEQQIASVYFETGMMSGEYGPAQRYQEKADALSEWLGDSNQRVSCFAKRQIRQFEAQAASETRRADQDIAQRRLDYGESIKPNGKSSDDPDSG